jgi:hypothetical protein
MSRISLYNHIIDRLDSVWTVQKQKVTYTAFATITNPSPKLYTSYRHSQFISDSVYLTLKSSLDDIGRLIMVDQEGREKIIHTPGLYFGEALSWSEGLAVWSERINDPRWDQRSYAVIKVFNTVTGKVEQLTKKSRFFAPSLSHDAKKIVTVEAGSTDHYSLVILNVNTGTEVKRITLPGNLFPMTPGWSGDDRSIVAVAMDNRGKALILADPESGHVRQITPFGFTEIATPVMLGNGFNPFTKCPEHVVFIGGL